MKLFFIICLSGLIIIASGLSLPFFKIKTITFTEKLIYLDKTIYKDFLSEFENKNIYNTIYFSNLKKSPLLFPEIKTISIKKTGLNKLFISLEERKSWISCIIEGNSFFIDKQGYILKRNNQITELETEHLFIVKGLSSNDLINNKIKTKTLTNLISLKNTFDSYLPNHSLLIEKTKINNWNLIIDDNTTILFGKLNNFEVKFKKLLHYLNSTAIKKNKNIDYIDCRINNKLLVSYGK
jgi:cell division septal protein FtsQ